MLDFGLAKAVSGDGSSPNVTPSPTVTAQTQTGVILGTAAYMSPGAGARQGRGQASGHLGVRSAALRDADGPPGVRRRDGVGHPGGGAEDGSDWTALPAETPANVRRVLRRCLERDRERRLHDIADARLELDESPEASSRAPQAAASRRAPRALLGGLALLFALLAALGWLAFRPKNPTPPPLRTAFSVRLSESDQIPFDDSPVLDLSRDGRQLVFTSDRGGARRLFVRSLDRIDARPLAGTEGAFSPFFSPDGDWIGFFADRKLKKVPAAGGVSFVIADAPNNRGGVWLTDDSIVYAPDYTTGLLRFSASGGKPEVP